MLFLWSSKYRSIFISVVFNFNASLNDVAPVSLILLAVILMKMERSFFDRDHLFVLFLLCSQLSSSFVSVVFDFSASLKDIPPASSILLSVHLMRMETWIVDGFHLFVLFCVHGPSQDL